MNLRKDHYHISLQNKQRRQPGVLCDSRPAACVPRNAIQLVVPHGARSTSKHFAPHSPQWLVKTTCDEANLSPNLSWRTDWEVKGPREERHETKHNVKTLSATDVLAPTTMKNAAKCDTSCELRNPVSHQNFERTLHFLRGVCLLECLFIPTSASCVLRRPLLCA